MNLFWFRGKRTGNWILLIAKGEEQGWQLLCHTEGGPEIETAKQNWELHATISLAEGEGEIATLYPAENHFVIRSRPGAGELATASMSI
jgi:hypothetical protein